MKRIVFSRAVCLLFLSITLCIGKLYAQVSVTATAGTTGPTAYTTISDAFAAINSGTHQGDVTIDITGNTTEPAVPTALTGSGTSSALYTSVLIKPNGGNFTVNSDATPTASRGIIELNGADNVTIDGDDPLTAGTRNLTIQAATSTNTGVACIRLSSASTSGANGADNNTVKNCILIGSRSSATSTTVCYGINMSNYSTTSMTTGAYSSLNTVIQNNEIRRCHDAIYANGASSTYLNTGTQILDNMIGSSIAGENVGRWGVYITYSSSSAGSGSAIIRGNDIRIGDVSPTGAGYSVSIGAINLNTTNAGALVEKNNLHDVYQPTTSGWGAYGVFISSATNNSDITIQNNFIRDMVASLYSTSLTSTYESYGIYINSAATGIKIKHNTIALLIPNTTGTVANATSAGIMVTSSSATIAELINNIIYNANTSTQAMGIYTAGTAVLSGGTVDNNNYYTPNGAVGYYNAGMRVSLMDWQAATLKDAASIGENPPFLSATDLHLSTSVPTALESGGAPTAITAITTDIDGDARPGPTGSVNGGGTAPDIGADEFDGTLLPALEMEATAFIYPANSAVIGAGNSFTPQASFTSNGATPQTNVPVRFQIIDASNTLIYNDATTIASINYGNTVAVSFTATNIATPGTYTIKAIVELPGDVTTTNDTLVGSITVQAALCGTYHIGAAQPAPFTTIADAVSLLNSVGVSCSVTFLLDDASYTETGSITFNQNIPGVSAANTVTVKPNTAATVLVSGNVSNSAFIQILSNNIIWDGSNIANGTTRDLTVTNTSTTTPTVIGLASIGTTPLTDVTLKNMTVTNGVNTSTAIVLIDAGGASGGYFNNITIRNNNIQRAYNGIFTLGVAASGNGSGILITENELNTSGTDAIRFTGIVIQGLDGATVSNNVIGNFSTSESEIDKGINITAGSANITVRGNTISNLAYTGTSTYNPQGILVGVGITNAGIVVDSNMIADFASTGTTTTLASCAAGILVSGATGDVTITRNRISNIKNNATSYAAYGIHLASSVAASNISLVNNFIADIAGNGSTTLARNGFGIYLSGGGGYNIYHNSISLTSSPTATGAITAAIGISSGVSSTAAMNIQNNIFSNEQTIGNRYALYSAVSSANSAGAFSNLDYNAYYSAGTNLAYFAGAAQVDLTTWQGAFASGNINSIAAQPLFNTATDLHLQNAAQNISLDNYGTATPIAGITTDIDGDVRPAGIATDMGADEFTTTTCNSSNGGNAVAAISSFCVTGNTTLSATGYSSGIGTAYEWQVSTDKVNFTPLGTEINPLSANTGTLTDTTYFRLAVTCSSVTGYSDTVTVFIHANPTASINAPSLAVMCAPGTELFTATTDANAPSYVWRNNGNIVSGATAATYSAGATGTYDVVVTDGGTNCMDTSNAETITVNPQPSALTISPSSLMHCGAPAMADTLIVSGGTTTDVTLLNEDFNGATNAWTTINNTTGGSNPALAEWTLRPNAYTGSGVGSTLTSNDASQFYLTDSDAPGSGNVTNTILQSPSMDATGYNALSLSFYHYYNYFSTTDTASVEVSTDGLNWTRVYASGTADIGAPSGFVQENVNLNAYAGNATVYVRFHYQASYGYGWAVDNVRISGDEMPVYTWSPASGLYDDAGATIAYTGSNKDTVYANPAATATYTASVTNSFGCSNAESITDSIVLPIAITTQPTASQTLCAGSTINLSVGANNATGYQWYNGATQLADGGNISGATTATLQIMNTTPSDAGNYFAVLLSVAPCGNDTTDTATVIIHAPVSGNTISSSQAICTGNTPTQLTGSTPTGGTSTYTYEWQSSITSATTGFSAASGTNNGVDYTPAALTQTTWYRRVVTSGVCDGDTSAAVEISVDMPIAGNTISGAQSLCIGDTATSLAGSMPSGGAPLGFIVDEDFDGATIPGTWTLVNTGNTLVSAISTVNSYGRTGSQGAIRAYNYNYSSGIGALTSVSFPATTGVEKLHFDVAAANYPSYGPDTLEILVDAGSGFTSLVTYITADVIDLPAGITTANATTSSFTPTSGQWGTKDLSLPAGTTQVRFNFKTGYGNNIWIDSVRVDGLYQYEWLSSTTSATSGYGSATGANTDKDYTPSVLTQTTWYKRVVNSGGACANVDTSAAIEVTVTMPIANNTISGAQSVCSGSTPTFLSGSMPSGGAPLSFVVDEDFDGATIPGTWTLVNTGNTLVAAMSTVNSYGRTGSQGAIRAYNYNYSSGIGALTSVSFPATTGVEKLHFDVAAANYPSYGPDTLEILVDAGSGFTSLVTYITSDVIDLPAGITTANATTSSFTPTSGQWGTKDLSLPAGTTQVRFNFKTGYGNNIWIDSVRVDGLYQYEWLSSTASATSGYGSATGANTDKDYTPSALTQTTWYKRVVNSGGACANVDTSAAIEVTVDTGATITMQPPSVVTTCSGNNVSLSVTADRAASYQWYKGATLLTNIGNISGATSSSLLITNATATDGGDYSVVVASSSINCGAVTSDTAMVSVNATNNVLANTGSSATISQTDGSTNTYSDASCSPIATITDASGGNVLGSVTASVTVDGTVQTQNGQPYLQRHYMITPFSNGAAIITLYATQLEFTAYNNAAGTYPLMPANGSDPAMANVMVTKYDGTPFASPATLITPTSVVWNSINNWWEITLSVIGFSSFYIHTGNAGPLDITLRDIKAINAGKRNRVDWTSSNETHADKYELERSADGISFEYLNTVKAKGDAAYYSYWDETAINGINYYRLKMYDLNGTFTYSKVVSAIVTEKEAFSVVAYPNPLAATDMLTVEVRGDRANNPMIVITDMAGKVVSQVRVTDLKTTLNVSHLASGMYFVKYIDDKHSETIKLNKQ